MEPHKERDKENRIHENLLMVLMVSQLTQIEAHCIETGLLDITQQ